MTTNRKAVLVMDTTNCCDECILSSIAYDSELFEEGECYCIIQMKSVDDIAEGSKPDWCPLKPMPEKIKFDSLINGSYEQGWNDYIDEICNK